MKPILILAIIGLLACSSSQNANNNTQDKVVIEAEECSNLYAFDNYFIDLDANNAVLIDGIPAKHFKTCSKYAHRFRNIVTDSVYLNGRSYIVDKNEEKGIYNINIVEGKKQTGTIKLPVERPLPEVHEYSIYLLPYQNDIIMFMENMYTTRYTICKYNAGGTEIMRTELEHTYITHPDPNTNEYNRYLYFYGLTGCQMIFSSHIAFADKNKTIVLSMDDFSTSEYDKTANGIILDENEKSLIGIVSKADDRFLVQMTDNTRYTFEIPYSSAACDLILQGHLLYIANYHPIATGSSLHCFDMKTGKMKWTADVKQINASHSEYYNKVTLSMYKNKIIMEGNEAYGDYVQLFDAETGKRLAVFGDFIEVK